MKYNLGCPSKIGGAHIGLYQPIFDCFLLTLNDYLDAQEVMLIAASRYNLVAMDLTSATNYYPNIIDNICCEKWSVPAKDSVTEIAYHEFLNLHRIETLVPISVENADIAAEKQYLQTVWHYVRYFNHELPEKNYSTAPRIKNFLRNVLGLYDSKNEALINLKRAVMKELYLSQDLELSKFRIDNFISETRSKHDIVF